MIKKLIFSSFLLFSSTVQAARPLDMCDSGSWYEPASDGQGLSVEITRNLRYDRPDVIVYYYTYDSYGYPFWLVGIGNRRTNNSSEVHLQFHRFYGRFPPDFRYNDKSVDFPAGTGSFNSDGMFKWRPDTILKNGGMADRNWRLEQLVSVCD